MDFYDDGIWESLLNSWLCSLTSNWPVSGRAAWFLENEKSFDGRSPSYSAYLRKQPENEIGRVFILKNGQNIKYRFIKIGIDGVKCS